MSVAVNQKSSQTDPATSAQIEFTVVFSKAITPASFTDADVTQGGTATAITGEGTLIPAPPLTSTVLNAAGWDVSSAPTHTFFNHVNYTLPKPPFPN